MSEGINTLITKVRLLSGDIIPEDMNTWVVWGSVAVFLVFFMLIVVVLKRYRKVGPNEAMIISGGMTRGVPKVVQGGGAFVWPIIQKAEILSLEVITIDVRTSTPRRATRSSSTASPRSRSTPPIRPSAPPASSFWAAGATRS
jgi:hypothetical protein